MLRNTPWVISIIAYAGEDTKARLNAAIMTGKISNMQRYLNVCVLAELACLLVLCIYFASIGERFDQQYNWLIRCFRYAITLYHVVPISLYVCFEILKLWLGRQIDQDPQLIDPDTGEPAKARTADLVEEMGQVDFVFSDKTGTLTANEMRFAHCDLVSGSFLANAQDGTGKPAGISQAVEILTKSDHPQHEAVLWLFTCLAVCHSVQADEQLRYSGPSPDEVALVEAAKIVGISFVKRESIPGNPGQCLTIVGPPGHPDRKFTVLHELEFTSDRKRMSVVCKHGGRTLCISKGADNIMEGLLLKQQFDTEQASKLQNFSQQGLRTLVVAWKEIDETSFATWEAGQLQAASSLEDRAEKLAKSAAQLEAKLEFAGITAVEDRLQDGVPAAIATVKAAGIRVWVLTGDKTETAVDIARSCRLFTAGMELAYITGAQNLEQTVALLQARFEGRPGNGIVLDGRTVSYLLQDAAAAQLLFEVGIASNACVCCRLSPAQKRRLVEVVRSCSPTTITLAIGDGANDVPMLQGAHLGIGIRGKEGAQAVMASDIAISQFRFLVPLLLCHGRRAYRRMATYLCYYLYKNVALAWGDIIWAHQNDFQGYTAYPSWLSSTFNSLFTAWPLLFVIGMDEDIPDWLANMNPEVYLEGPQRAWFNYTVFGVWMLTAAYHGSLAWTIPMVAFGTDQYGTVDFWRTSVVAFTVVIFIISLKLFMHSFSRLKLSTLLPISASVALYMACLFYLGATDADLSENNGEPSAPVWSFSRVWPLLVLFLGPPLILAGDWAILLFYRRLRPSPLHRLRAAKRADLVKPPTSATE